ncbi:MAG: rhodanese-like domain-containing protein [Janthinobacterium lividum]
MTTPFNSHVTAAPERAEPINPQTLRQWVHDGQELAILDVREKGAFARGHLLLARNAPLWRLELLIERLVPRRDTRIVLLDADGSLLQRATHKLKLLGYTNLAALHGGTAAWEQEGLQVFTGTNVVSKAFGEAIEEALHTPHIDVEALRQKVEAGADVVVVDGRTPEEFQRFSLPFAHSLPNGELVYRIEELAPRPQTLIVVNCAGRTRSILGAQTLINAGLENPVVALKDGTMAWLREGHALRHGATSPLPEPSRNSLEKARARAQQVAQRAGVRHIDHAELTRLESADEQRTLYRFDVRTAVEYRAGHLPGWRWAPGGQLIQTTDQYIGTYHARVVIADWDGVRAHTTAAWLAQLGHYEVFLYRPADYEKEHPTLALGQEGLSVRTTGEPTAPWISASALDALRSDAQASVFDVDSSLAFAERHIEGARFSAPDRLPEWLADVPASHTLVITSADGVLARLVASELQNHHQRKAFALLGGNAGWFELNLPTAKGRADILTGEDDDWYSPYVYETQAERERKMHEYLTWEVALAEQIVRDGDVKFRLVHA